MQIMTLLLPTMAALNMAQGLARPLALWARISRRRALDMGQADQEPPPIVITTPLPLS